MSALLRGFLLIALLVAVPFAVDQFYGRHPLVQVGSHSSVKDCRPDCSPNCARDCVKGSTSSWRDWLPSSRDLLPQTDIGKAMLFLAIFSVIALVIFLLIQLLTYEIAEWLTLAEREMNSLLRGWGGGYGNRKDVVKERADWLSMIPVTDDPAPFADVYNKFFDLNQKDLESGGSQGAAMGKVRMTAFLLRELYEGNVQNAQLKIFNEYINSTKNPKEPPFIAPGIRQIVGYEYFDPNNIRDNGFPPGAGVNPNLLWLTVRFRRFPHNIVMIRTDKSRVRNMLAIEELTMQAAPAVDEPAVPLNVLKGWLKADSSMVPFAVLAILFLGALVALLYLLGYL